MFKDHNSDRVASSENTYFEYTDEEKGMYVR